MSRTQTVAMIISAFAAAWLLTRLNQNPKVNPTPPATLTIRKIGESEIPLFPGITIEVESNELDTNLIKGVDSANHRPIVGAKPATKTKWFWRFDYNGNQQQVVDFYKTQFENIYGAYNSFVDENGEPFTVHSLRTESFANCSDEFKWQIDILIYDDSIVITHFLHRREWPILMDVENEMYTRLNDNKAVNQNR